MSLKGVGRFAKAPQRQANWPQAARLWVHWIPFVEAGEPAARTRQIQIRNRQQHLHTAGDAEWQARPVGRPVSVDPARGLRMTYGQADSAVRPGRKILGRFIGLPDGTNVE
jgi:hypothetical protein